MNAHFSLPPLPSPPTAAALESSSGNVTPTNTTTTNANANTTNDEAAVKRRKVTRSRAGCLTCRKRRKLCDFEKPICGACGRLDLECKWPANIPGEASRSNTATGSDTPKVRKKYNSTSSPALPTLGSKRSSNDSINGVNGAGFGNGNGSSGPSRRNTPQPQPGYAGAAGTVASANGGFAPGPSLPGMDFGAGAGIGTGTLNFGSVNSGETMDDLVNIFGQSQANHTNSNNNNNIGSTSTANMFDIPTPAQGGLLQMPLVDPIPVGGLGVSANVNMGGTGYGATFGNMNGMGGVGGQDNSNMFGNLGFDDTTLQLWAADLFNMKDPVNPWDSLSSLLAPRPEGQAPSRSENTSSNPPLSTFPPTPSSDPPFPHGRNPNSTSTTTTTTSSDISRSPITNRPIVHSEAPHRPLAAHYQESLSRMVACIPEDSVNGFDAFTTLASATATSQAGKGLHLATLSWAGRHMSNLGQVKYEALSERLAIQAKGILFGILDGMSAGQKRGVEGGVGDTERMTLMGGMLMLVQFKICRGDVWGFIEYMDHIRDLAEALFGIGKEVLPMPSDSMLYSFFENLAFHDLLSSFIFQERGSIISTETLHALSAAMGEGLNTLTGSTFHLISIGQRIFNLIREGRMRRSGSWNDDTLIDTVSSAHDLEKLLDAEKDRYQALVNTKPIAFAPWQYMHESFRIASTVCVRSFVLGAPPTSIGIRLLVRQSLTLLETMYEQDLPGFCSAHWQLFMTALCAVPGKSGRDQLDDRERIIRMYDSVLGDLGFKNVARSRQVVEEVWSRNQGGQVSVDWLDIVQEWEWELFLV